MSVADFDERLSRRLGELLARFKARITAANCAAIHDLIETNEYGVALDHMVNVLAGTGTPITREERTDIIDAADVLGAREWVVSMLKLCPET